ncbi:MAG: divergent PAP2 family protein [Kiritimatiellae bacterium]|nr:divergent PAP2 family protein [Kiritimatiellia bacterium]
MTIVDYNPFNLLTGPWFWAAFLGWINAQVVKMIRGIVKTGKVDFQYLLSTGGMPSAHSSLVNALWMSIGLTEGFDRPMTMLAVGFASITMFDAAVVRRAAGHQARILNQITEELATSRRVRYAKLRELLGHTRTEVFAGMATGMATAYLVVSLWRG